MKEYFGTGKGNRREEGREGCLHWVGSESGRVGEE